MKTCTICKDLKELVDFPLINKEKQKRSSMCLPCKQQYDRDNYQKHRESRIESKKENAKKIRERNGKYVLEFLSKNPCVDCGETDPIVLEFDHQKDKHKNIADLKSYSSIEILQAEIDKCQVVCANCHARRTAKQFGYYKYGSVM